jgi:hypothetical protein
MRDPDRIAEFLLLGSVMLPTALAWTGALAEGFLLWVVLLATGLGWAAKSDDAPFRKPWDYGDRPGGD